MCSRRRIAAPACLVSGPDGEKTDEPQHGFPKTDDSQDINRKSRNTAQYGAGKATVFFGTAMKERVAY